MSPITWTRVEKGKAVRALTYAGIERALILRANTINDFLKGAVTLETEDVEESTDELEDAIRSSEWLSEDHKTHLLKQLSIIRESTQYAKLEPEVKAIAERMSATKKTAPIRRDENKRSGRKTAAPSEDEIHKRTSKG